MKTLTFTNNKLQLKDIPKPKPKQGEVLIKILYSAICNTDLEITKGYMGFNGVLGHEFVGRVVSKDNNLYNKNVVGEINCYCENCEMCQSNRTTHCYNRTTLGIDRQQGVFADYICLPEKIIHIIPDNLSLEKAVFTEPLAAAIEIFEQNHIKSTDEILILGAGKLGLLIAQVFKLNGCNYLLTDKNKSKINLAINLNLNSESIIKLSENKKYEIIVECSGSKNGIVFALNHLKPRGKLILKTTVANSSKIDLNQIVINEFSLCGSRCGPFEPALRLLSKNLINITPLISKIFTFNNIIQAFEYARKKNTVKVLVKHDKNF